MNTILHKISNFFTFRSIFLMTSVSTLIYFICKTYLFYHYESPIGDESSFLEANDFIEKNGLFYELCKGQISPLFSIISTFLNYFINDMLLTFRLISVVSTILTLLLVYHFAKNKLNISGYYLQTIVVLCISFFCFRIYWQGINDAIFHLFIVICFYLLYDVDFKKNVFRNLIYIGIVFGLMISTRLMSFLVLPCFVFFFVNSYKKILIVGVTTSITALLFHFPSLINGNGLSDQNKDPKNGMTWVQLNYLSQKLIYENKLEKGYRVSWEELAQYIKVNGKESLPKNTLELFTFSPKITINSLVNNLIYSIQKVYFKFFGFGVFILFYVYYFYYKNRKSIATATAFSFKFANSFWFYTFMISLIAFTQIEPRWYTSFIYFAILISVHFFQNFNKISPETKIDILKINLIVLVFFQWRFMFKEIIFL